MAIQVTITARHLRRAALALAALIVLAALLALLSTLVEPADPFDGRVKQGRYQAVTLNEGSIYFGHLRPAGDDFYRLSDVHLIRQTPAEGKNKEPKTQVQPLREQLFGPENEMLIDRDDIVSVSNLRRDSEVVKVIERLDK